MGSTSSNFANSNIVPSEAIPIPVIPASSDCESRLDVNGDSAMGNFSCSCTYDSSCQIVILTLKMALCRW